MKTQHCRCFLKYLHAHIWKVWAMVPLQIKSLVLGMGWVFWSYWQGTSQKSLNSYRLLSVFFAHHDLTVWPYCWEHEEIKQVLIWKPHSYRPDFTVLEGAFNATRWKKKKRNRSYSAVNTASYSDNWLGKTRWLVPKALKSCGEPTSFRLDLKLTPVWNSHLALLAGPRTSGWLGQRP